MCINSLSNVKTLSVIPFDTTRKKLDISYNKSLLHTNQSMENYSTVKKYYDQKIKSDGKLFDSQYELLKILSDKKQLQNLQFYIREHAEEELKKLEPKGLKTSSDDEMIEGLKEIIKAFPSIHSYKDNSNKILTFKGKISEEDRIKCHKIIHSTSAICGTASALAGEGAALGADSPALWGAQFIMFSLLQNILQTDDLSHLQYIGRQYVSGAYLGIKGARIICGWLGLGAHVATAGTTAPAVTGAVRAVNASLSTVITEKMGWGYVHDYEHNMMTPKQQMIKNLSYGVGLYLFNINNDSTNLDINNPADIAKALNDMSNNKDFKLLGEVLKKLGNHRELYRTSTVFLSCLGQSLLCDRNNKEEFKKNLIRNLERGLINSVIYVAFSEIDDNCTEEEAKETIRNFEKKLHSYPEVFQELKKTEQELLNKLDIDKIDSKEFLNKFRDKTFLYNLSITAGESAKIIADNLKKQDFINLNNENKKICKEINKIDNNKKTLSDEDYKVLSKELNKVITETKKNLSKELLSNFAFSKIAGYDNVKTLLNLVLINPIKNNDIKIPNSILFYGPSGTGKTTLGIASAEETGARMRVRDLGIEDDNKLLEWIEKQMNDAEQLYNDKERYTFIQLNEFEDFGQSNPDNIDKFIKLENDASKKHCVLLLTTNNPLMIDKKILASLDIKIPLGVADKNDTKEIIKHYSDRNCPLNENEIIRLTEQFEQVKPTNAYSNSQIENIFIGKVKKDVLPFKYFSDRINTIKPAIKKSALDKFDKERNILNGDV